MAEKEKKEPAQVKRAGFDEKGKPYPGVNDAGERVTVTLDALKDEFGPKTGEKLYRRVAEAAGVGVTVTSGVEYNPDISLAGADESVRARVAEILAEKE